MRSLLFLALLVSSSAAVAFDEPAAGTPERKAIMDAMRGPMSAYIGAKVEFTGSVRVTGGWARFVGDLAPTDGKKPTAARLIEALELDLAAFLKLDPDGHWQLLHWGFSGDVGVMDEARARFPEAPSALFEW